MSESCKTKQRKTNIITSDNEHIFLTAPRLWKNTHTGTPQRDRDVSVQHKTTLRITSIEKGANNQFETRQTNF